MTSARRIPAARLEQFTRECLAGYAANLGLDVAQFLVDLDDLDLLERVRADVASAEASGARGTPTFFVGTRRHVGPYDAATLIRELEMTRSAAPAAEGT